jgi:biopolymer transport protein TolQ
MNIVQMIWNMGYVGKGVLATLLFFSIASWTLIIFKLRVLGRALAESERFTQRFRDSKNLHATFEEARALPNAPSASLFRQGYRELSQMVKANPGAGTAARGGDGGVAVAEEVSTLDGLERVRRTLRHASIQQLSELERHLIFLATTGSVTPFIGLFGTVWGIMIAFHQIGATGSAGLGAVGPGIAEALINTAGGLLAAVPAVIAYNYFLHRIKAVATILDLFTLEFLGIAERVLGRR